MRAGVRRIAIDSKHFDNDTGAVVSPEHAASFLAALRGVPHEGLAKLIARSAGGTVAVCGPAWRPFVSPNELASLDARVYDFLVPVKNEPRLACPQLSWKHTDVQVYLNDASKQQICKLVVGGDSEFVEVTAIETKTIYDNEVEFDARLEAAFATLIEHAMPTPASIVAALPKPSLGTWKSSPASRWCLLPEWAVSTLLRWTSQHLRIHVIASAAVELDANSMGPPSILFLDHASMEHVSFKGAASRRINLKLHKSTCACLCKHHRTHNRHAGGTHANTELALEFCGCRLSNGRCVYHPTKESPPFQNDDPVADKICMHGLSLKLKCTHETRDAASNSHAALQKPIHTTVLDVPLESNPFAVSFAAACVELSEGTPEPERIQSLVDYVATAFDDAMQNDREERQSVPMLKRDQMTESMLRSGEFFFGPCPSRNNGKLTLRKRKQPGTIPKWMHECVTTHSHLLPNR